MSDQNPNTPDDRDLPSEPRDRGEQDPTNEGTGPEAAAPEGMEPEVQDVHGTDPEAPAEDPADEAAAAAEEPELAAADEDAEAVVNAAEEILGEAGQEADAIVEEASEGPAAAAAATDREAELQADLQRLQAEYVNYRRRVDRDRATEKDRTVGQVITELMPVLDDIAAARQAGDLEDGPFAHIANRLESVLQQQGLERVDEVGVPFDPTIHEAIMQQPHEEIEADHVAVVLRAGYRHGDRLLRAAQVMVSSGPAE